MFVMGLDLIQRQSRIEASEAALLSILQGRAAQ